MLTPARVVTDAEGRAGVPITFRSDRFGVYHVRVRHADAEATGVRYSRRIFVR
jgi:hypothetical protein